MSGKLFREFVSLFKEWPIDTGKGSRCLGVYIRKHFSQHFQRGELSENVNVQEWSKTLHDLKQISNDVYLKRYPRERKTGALGLDKDVCRAILTDNFLKILQNQKGL